MSACGGRPWDDLPLSASERANYERAGMGAEDIPLGGTPALAIVDMNRAFSDSRFPLGSSEAAKPALEAIASLLPVARAAGAPVLYSTTFTTRHHAVKGLWKGSGGDPADPLLASEAAHEIPAEIAPAEDEPILEKAKPSAFWQTGLSDILAFHRVDTLIVAGMSTSGCVRATVVDAFSHNLRTVVPIEGVADRGALSHKVSLFDMHMKYANVWPLWDVIAHLTDGDDA